MSLKVYNGIKFHSKNCVEIVEQLYSIKKQVLENSKKYAINNNEELYYFIKYHKLDINDTMRIATELRNAESNEFRSYDIPNFLAEVVVIPWDDGNVYGIYYCDDIKENEDLILSIADEYYYQNQTDKPEDISDEEWSERSEVWNDIFDNYFAPSDAGFVYKLVNPSDYDFFLVKEVLDKFQETHIDCYTYDFKLPKDKIENFNILLKNNIYHKFVSWNSKEHLSYIVAIDDNEKEIVDNIIKENQIDITAIEGKTAKSKIENFKNQEHTTLNIV